MENITLKEFITQTLNDVYAGAKESGNYINSSKYVKFKVVVSNTTKVDGGVKVYVLNAGGGESEEKSTQIEFELPLAKQSEIDDGVKWAEEQN